MTEALHDLTLGDEFWVITQSATCTAFDEVAANIRNVAGQHSAANHDVFVGFSAAISLRTLLSVVVS